MRSVLLLLAALTPAFPAAAETPDVSATSDWSTGNGYRGWGGKASVDFGKHPDWGLNTSFAWAHSHAGTESLSKQFTVGFDHTPDDNWSFRGAVTGWREYISNVRYAGPSWGVTYLVNAESSPKPKPAAAGAESEDSSDDEDQTPEEILGVSFDNDLFFYHAPQTNTTHIVAVRGKRVVAPPIPSAINMTQWHPTFQVEKPFLHESVVPSVSFGHYFYTSDPGVIESRSGSSRFSASAGSLSGLAGGLFKNDVTPALDLVLPWHFRIHGSIALSQAATDNSWATTEEMSVKCTIKGRVSLKGKMDHTIQGGQGTDQYTVALTLLF